MDEKDQTIFSVQGVWNMSRISELREIDEIRLRLGVQKRMEWSGMIITEWKGMKWNGMYLSKGNEWN